MHFMIVGKKDPLYEAKLAPKSRVSLITDEVAYLNQFVLHSSLDMVGTAKENNSATFLNVVDKFSQSHVSAYITPGGVTFLLLHNGKSEEATRHFFVDVHELYARHVLNPLTQLDAPIVSPRFDELVRAAGAKLYIK